MHLPVGGDDQLHGPILSFSYFLLLFIQKNLYAGKGGSFPKFQCGAASGGDKTDLIGETETLQGGDDISTADDGESPAAGYSAGNLFGAPVKWSGLKDAQRTVPKDRASLRNDIAIKGGGLGADINGFPPFGNLPHSYVFKGAVRF